MKQQTPIPGGRTPQQNAAVQRALSEAVQLHAAGRYDDVLKLVASSGLAKTAAGQNLTGDIHLKRGNPREALKAFDAAASIAPTAPEPYANRGAALMELGRNDEALAALDRALRMRPEYANAHFNRGNVLRALGRFDEAVTAYTRALRAQAQFPEAHLNRGTALGALKRWPEALEEFAKALRLRPNFTGAQIARAMVYRDMGQFPDAFVAIDALLAGEPANRDALRFRCSLLNTVQKHGEALQVADRLLADDPGDADVMAERAEALLKLRRMPEALVAVDALITAQPARAEAHVTRAAVMAELGRQEESLAAIDEARRLGAPEQAYLPVLAQAQAVLGDHLAALANFERAIAADPNAFQTYYNRAFLRLYTGDWANGWQDHEWRLRQHDHPHRGMSRLAPTWQGEPIAGKRLLVYPEQGLGDTIQFLRYVPRLRETGAALTLSVQPALTRLVAANFPDLDVTGALGLRQGFDFQVSLMSLPAVFRDTMESLPRETPYLHADPGRITKWRERIGRDAFNVGIVWQGAPGYTRDATRSIPLSKYAPLARVPGVRLFSVQAQVGLDQLDRLGAELHIHRFGEELENNPDGLQEMAAIMSNLDLLIMSDTAPTHLGGALGRPVWVALSHYPDWRWMEKREDSIWYPTMRLFRQQNAGDWDGVFSRIADELAKEASQLSG